GRPRQHHRDRLDIPTVASPHALALLLDESAAESAAEPIVPHRVDYALAQHIPPRAGTTSTSIQEGTMQARIRQVSLFTAVAVTLTMTLGGTAFAQTVGT